MARGRRPAASGQRCARGAAEARSASGQAVQGEEKGCAACLGSLQQSLLVAPVWPWLLLLVGVQCQRWLANWFSVNAGSSAAHILFLGRCGAGTRASSGAIFFRSKLHWSPDQRACSRAELHRRQCQDRQRLQHAGRATGRAAAACCKVMVKYPSLLCPHQDR